MWNTAVTKYSDNLKPPAKLELGSYPMLAGATDAGLFMKPSMMLSIGKTTQHPQAAAKLINFLLNSKEGVTLLGLERGVPLSKSGVETLTASGVINDKDPSVAGIKLALSLPAKVGVSPYLEDPSWCRSLTARCSPSTTARKPSPKRRRISSVSRSAS